MNSGKNKFNTTPDGTSIVNINDVINLPTTITINPTHTPYIDNIIILNPTKTIFILSKGTYKLVNVFNLSKNGVHIIGQTGNAADVIIQQTSNLDGIDMSGKNIVLQDITIQCTYSQKVCLTVSDATNTVVAGCKFYCAPDFFGIYYAGPHSLREGQTTLDGYNNYVLDTGNVFYNNAVYTSYTGDSVSFSLQYKAQFVGNYIRGGKVAVYMCRTTNVYNNTITDSTSNGIYVSLPSDNLSIIGNKIYNSTYSGIKLSNQLEHGAFPTYSYNILIKHNTIFGSKFYGIEMGFCDNIKILNNKIMHGQSMGIYSYAGKNLIIKNNKIAYFNFAVFLELNSDSIIDSNVITSIFPVLASNSIKIVTNPNCINNTVSNNIFNGQHKSVVLAGTNTFNIDSNNTINILYSINDENLYNVI